MSQGSGVLPGSSSHSAFSHLFGVRPLAARLLPYLLVASLCLALVATGLQLAVESGRRFTELQSFQERIADSVAPHLNHQLRQMNGLEVDLILQNLLASDVISHARVTTPEGAEFSRGDYPDGQTVSYRHLLTPLAPDNGEVPAGGQLILTSSAGQVYASMIGYGLSLWLFQSLVAVVVALVLLLFVRFFLSRHLAALSASTGQLSLDALAEPLALRRPPPARPDQLAELEQALNRMRERLLEEARGLRQDSLAAREERDEAMRANHAKNLFLASVSHELRIPLQSVLGYAGLLLDTRLDQEQRDYTHTLRNAAEDLAAILDDLLDISRMEEGRLELDEVAFSPRDLLDEVIQMLGLRAREKGLALDLRIDDRLPFELEGDPVRLRQILLNLTANAIRFTESGHVLIGAEMLGLKQGEARLRLSVEDTGVGISPEDLPRLLDPEAHPGSNDQRHISDAVRGLDICRHLAGLMGGRLDVESTPGKGSTFWVEVSLPLTGDNGRDQQISLHRIRGRRLLVVDSYALSRKITLEMLARLETDNDAARTGAEALSALKQATENATPFDAVILDGFVPDMGSDLLCRQIRDTPAWADTRLLILSGNPQRGDAEHFREAGADAFLSKALRESRLALLLDALFADANAGERRFLTRFSVQMSAPVARADVQTGRGMDVLVVEDNPVNLALTRRLLEKLGCSVSTAVNGHEASELWRGQRFDLIFMDCVMPELDGFETTRQLRAWEVRTGAPHTPVVALTASAMEQDEERSLRAGMDAFVAKPVNIDMLQAVLEQYAANGCPT